MAKEFIICNKKENVNKAIKTIGQELTRRADDISNDVERVGTIIINAVLTPTEILNFNVVKNYIAEFESEV